VTAKASTTNSPPLVMPPPSNPAIPFQPLQNSQNRANTMVKGNQQQQQALTVEPQPTLPLVPGLDAASYESHIQVIPPADGSSSVGSKEAVILGLQALERQQEESERRRASTPAVRRDNPFDVLSQHDKRSGYPQDFPYEGDVPSMVHLPTDEDDSQKTLSSINRDTSACDGKGKRSIGKLIRSSMRMKKRTGKQLRKKVDNNVSSINPDKNDTTADNKFKKYTKPIISGYLFKRGRQGKWQRRWFESDGKYLLYFKSQKRNKLLATLDLLHVGSVAMDDTDPANCSFIIEVAGRNYYLCANSKDHATDWVISMNRVREARMEIGNLKLIEPRQDGVKICDDDYAPSRVSLVAPRKRAKGLRSEDFNEGVEDLIDSKDCENSNNVSGVSGFTGTLSPGSGVESVVSSNISSRHLVSGPGGQHPNRRQRVLVRWRKRRPSYQNWMRRLSRWAKRITSVRCIVKEDFQHLDESTEFRHFSEKTRKSPIVDTHDSMPQDNNDGGLTGQNFSINSSFVAPLDPTMKYAHYTDLDPEIHVAGRTLNQISEGDATLSETSKPRTNDEVYPAYEQKTKVPTSAWTHKRALKKKLEDSSSRENSANEDVDSTSGQESPTSIDYESDEASGVV